MPDWIREYFERGYGQRWGLPAPNDLVRLEADGLYDLLQLSSASRVIDIGCGHGRHAFALAERGVDVIGLDFTVALLKRAQHLAVELDSQARWVRGDMRRLPFRSGSADAALVLDALGFFETDEEHETVLREAARVLTPGGRLGLKIVNAGPVLEGFRDRDRTERDGAVISISRTLMRDPPRLTEKISIRGSRADGEYQRRQRLYRIEELVAVLERAGFAIVSVYARPDGTPFDPAVSSTMWIVGQRDAG